MKLSSLRVVAFAAVLIAIPASAASDVETIQDVIDLLIAKSERSNIENTVDLPKTGDPSVPVTGILTTFMANTETIRQAISVGANLIISHETLFYNHRDRVDWLEGDDVYAHKLGLLNQHGIVVFRFHDYIHGFRPDPILQENIEALGWTERLEEGSRNVVSLPEGRLEDLVRHVKASLDADNLRVIGDPNMTYTRVGIMPGAPPSQRQMEFTRRSEVDVLIAGEIREWETPEYFRDAISAGQNRALIVTGHSPSESYGMAWLARWLNEELAEVPVVYFETRAPFWYH